MDKNDYYGGESSSINLNQLWKRFRGNDQPPAKLGASREYNVDMIPKECGIYVHYQFNFMVANGILVRVLIHANVTKYLNFKAVDDSFVCNKGKIHIVPATDVEAYVEFDGDGKVIGVTSEGETVKCKKVVSDPYLFCCSYTHYVAPKGKYMAFVSAEAETENPDVELKLGVDLLGPVDEIFFDTYDTFVPTNNNDSDLCFISKSYDATRHFESTMTYVLAMYTKITGKVLDLSVDLSAASAGADL